MMLRSLIAVAVLLALSCAKAAGEPRHGLSIFGDLKYPAGFHHFDYVNPDASKGGRLVLLSSEAVQTFDSLNGFILKGDAAHGLRLLFDTLMARALDEPDAAYGLLAQTVELSPDRTSLVFHLRPEARFADGTPVTSDDVVFSILALKEHGHPGFQFPLRGVAAAEAPDPQTVRFRLEGGNLRDLPVVIASAPIFSKAWYRTRKFEESSLDAPLGSGPYRVKELRQGQFITYARRPDYWAKDLPVNRGQFNFDEVRYEYFRERIAAVEAIKAGTLDLKEEFTSKDWATGYEGLPQIADKRLLKLTLPDKTPSGAQGFFLNLRRAKFQDIRVRRAFGLAFDFEWSNRNLFYNLYERSVSLFENSPLKASGPPSPEEVALIEPFRAELPADIFTAPPVIPPRSDGSGADRGLLREASQLLDAAGFRQQGGKRIGPDGQPLTAEFLTEDSSLDRVILPYVRNLAAIGIDASIRRVDDAQYERRIKDFDFDVTTRRYTMPSTPGADLLQILSSASVDAHGSYNIGGIKSKVVDALIDKALAARSRAELLTAVHALDRVLRAGLYMVPHWFKPIHTMLVWDKFGRPAEPPAWDEAELGSAETWVKTWWYDDVRAGRVTAK